MDVSNLLIEEFNISVKEYAKRRKSLSLSDKVSLISYGQYVVKRIVRITSVPYKKISEKANEELRLELELLYDLNSTITSRERLFQIIRLIEAKPTNWRWLCIKTWLDDQVSIIKHRNKKGI